MSETYTIKISEIQYQLKSLLGTNKLLLQTNQAKMQAAAMEQVKNQITEGHLADLVHAFEQRETKEAIEKAEEITETEAKGKPLDLDEAQEKQIKKMMQGFSSSLVDLLDEDQLLFRRRMIMASLVTPELIEVETYEVYFGEGRRFEHVHELFQAIVDHNIGDPNKKKDSPPSGVKRST